jgi:selenocysteine-specific elongation factor
MVLDPALHAPADRIDAEVRLLASEPRPLAHWTPVRLHHAAAELGARVALLEAAPIAPGAQGLIQLVLERAIAAACGDRFILRDTSGARTIAGGRFLDLRGPARRRRRPERLAQLAALGLQDAGEALAALLERWPFAVDIAAFARDRALGQAQTEAALKDAPHVRIGERFAVSPAVWEQLAASARTALTSFHGAHPELPGLAPSRLAAVLEPRLPAEAAAGAVAALVAAGTLAAEGGAVHTPEHRFGLDPRDQRLWAKIAPLLSDAERFRPPRAGEIAPLLREPEAEVRRVLKALARRRDVIEIAPDHFFRRETVDEMARIAADIAGAEADGQFSAAQLRDRLNNGRKVAIQVLEYFDRRGLTLRRGDLRRINPSRLEQFAAHDR